MGYSQALEEQLRLLRFMQEQGKDYMARAAGLRGASAETGRIVWEMIGATLEVAEPFYWSPEMCDVLVSVAETMPTWTLRHTDLLAPSGFMHFAKPLRLPPTRHGIDAAPLAGIGWYVGEPAEDGRRQIVVSMFAQIGPRSYPFVAVPFFDGEAMVSFLDEVAGKKAETKKEYDRETLETSLRYIGAAISLCRQRIIVTPGARAERGTRKRALDLWEHEPIIRVVQLRRVAVPSQHDGDPQTVEWSCRWIVSGHWRQQWHPSTGDHQPIWILPYVKGPESAPLKAPRAKVFEVVR